MTTDIDTSWRDQLVSFRVTPQAARQLTQRSIWSNEDSVPPSWFNPRYEIGGTAHARLGVLKAPDEATAWRQFCVRHKVVAIVVAWPGEAPNAISYLKDIRLTFLEPGPDHDWLDDGWLLRRMATPDAPVLNDLHRRRHGYPTEQDRLSKQLGAAHLRHYAKAVSAWLTHNFTDNTTSAAWDPQWSDWDDQYGLTSLTRANAFFEIAGQFATVTLREAPYIQVKVPLLERAAATPPPAAPFDGYGGWLQISPELYAEIQARQHRLIQIANMAAVPFTLVDDLFQTLHESFRMKRTLSVQSEAVGETFTIDLSTFDNLTSGTDIDLHGQRIRISAIADVNTETETAELSRSALLSAIWDSATHTRQPAFDIELTLTSPADPTLKRTALLAIGQIAELGFMPLVSGQQLIATVQLKGAQT